MCVGEDVSLIGASLSPSEMMLDPLLLTDRSTTVPRSPGAARFASDSLLEVAVTSELVSETTVSGLLECGWELSGR
jgi:hypothetical protein